MRLGQNMKIWLSALRTDNAPSNRTIKPWGYFDVLSGPEEKYYKAKVLAVYPNQRLSYQSHLKRDEHWYIVGGNGLVTLKGVDTKVTAGSNVVIPKGAPHRVKCTGEVPLVILELQTGESFEESDIVRLEDDYDRVK